MGHFVFVFFNYFIPNQLFVPPQSQLALKPKSDSNFAASIDRPPPLPQAVI
jgi:hypothetical protein